ncbi:MAG: hypothetical protein IMZ53_00520 [Thermoplasmata archaeon]|nr:hypothetical protein [Thermoplasmata archaeon]
MDAVFEGATINGKQFPFVRVTVTRQAKIISKFKPTLRGIIANSLFPSSQNKRMWKKVRSVAFVKYGLWKIGIIPKELRCSEMQLKLAGELQANFFGYVAAEVKGHDEPLSAVRGSQTETSPAK